MRVQQEPFESRLNPYVNLFRTALERQGVTVTPFALTVTGGGPADVVHFHWPEVHLRARTYRGAILGPLRLLPRLVALRSRGTKIVWTVHNLTAHDECHPALEQVWWRAFARLVDGVICLTPSSRDLVRARHPGLARAATAVIPHGHYRDVLPAPPPRREAKRRLDLPADSFLIGFFGLLRAYKNVPHLVEAFRAWRDAGCALLVVGHPSEPAVSAEVARLAAGADNIRVVRRFVTDEESALYVGAADLLALPYVSFLHSGAAYLALSLNTPVLLPDTPVTRDLEGEFGTRWVVRFDAPLRPAHLDRARALVPTNSADRLAMEGHDWDLIGTATVGFYRRLAAGGGDGRGP